MIDVTNTITDAINKFFPDTNPRDTAFAIDVADCVVPEGYIETENKGKLTYAILDITSTDDSSTYFIRFTDEKMTTLDITCDPSVNVIKHSYRRWPNILMWMICQNVRGRKYIDDISLSNC